MREFITQQPLITIITVTLNAERFIESTILSVIEQDYNNIEYIIIDGASDDNTNSIIMEYSENINFFVSEPDQGIYHAMNKAVNFASGKWINFMNAGDTFSSNEIISSIFEKEYEADLIYGDSILVNTKTNTEYYLEASSLSSINSAQMPFVHQSVFLKRSLLKKFRFRTDYVLASDFDLFLNLYIRGYVFHYLKGLPVSKFLSDGLHSTNRIKYTSECVNSLVATLDSVEEFASSCGIVKAFDELNSRYKNNNLDFSVLFSSLLLQIELFFRQYDNVVIYGCGLFGQLLAAKYESKVVAITDKNNDSSINDHKITDLKTINKLDYEKIIITVLGREDEILKSLDVAGIPKSKIYTLEL